MNKRSGLSQPPELGWIKIHAVKNAFLSSVRRSGSAGGNDPPQGSGVPLFSMG